MSTKMLSSSSSSSSTIPVDSRALYLAINARDGYYAEKNMPVVARENSKILNLNGQDQQGLIYKAKKSGESDFLAAYSGEILTTRQLLTHKDARTHAYTIALVHEEEEDGVESEIPIRYLSRRWLFSGWNALGERDLAIFANHQIANNEQRWTFLELYVKLYPKENYQKDGEERNAEYDKLVKDGKKRNKFALNRLADSLGTHQLFFWHTNALHTSMLTFDEIMEKALDVNLSTEYRVQVKYPANAQLARMLLDRTFILSNNSVDKNTIDILGGGAERNRLVHWRGTISCRVTYIEKIPDAKIVEGDEILVTYGPEYQEYNSGVDKTFSLRRTTAYYPANRPYLSLFSRDEAQKDNRYVNNLKVANNADMAKVLRDLVPLILLRDNINNEVPYIADYVVNRFVNKYNVAQRPKDVDSAIFIRMLVSETFGLLFNQEYAAFFDKVVGGDSLVTFFVGTIHYTAEFVQADEMDRIAQSLYKASFIHFMPDKEALDEVNIILSGLRDERSRRSRELCFGEELSHLEEIGSAKILSAYYEIPLLGVTNLFYRDALYYMTRDDDDDDHHFAESLSGYNRKMRVYTASRDAFARLVAPIIHYANGKLEQVDKEQLVTVALEEKVYANTLNGLKMTFIYHAEAFDTHRRAADYLTLTLIYMRLFAMMRLLPLTQLEDSWLNRLYRQYRLLYIGVSQKYVLLRDTNTLDRDTPTSPLSLLAPFDDYRTIKKKWYARVTTL